MSSNSVLPPVQIGPVAKALAPMALGSFIFGADAWRPEAQAQLNATMQAALDHGITHFDTATGYGAGQSEELIGNFLQGKRAQVFLASKASIDEMDADLMYRHVQASLDRLRTDTIDLYYIHWPRQGKDIRPMMEGLERARREGKIGAIGVSNFSVENMEQVREVGPIHAHQMAYNLFWRFAENEVIPYCVANDIAVVTYSSIAQGVLTGKFGRDPQLPPGDNRGRVVHFDDDVWPHVYAGVEALKPLADEVERPLAHLAIRWVIEQPFIHTAVVGARLPEQVAQNAAALAGEIPESVFARMTDISDEVMRHIPNTGNPYRHYP
ncbi:MAG: aldo/keto reductase [Caldilineaceae bacterium]|nr:aldo/keto reductase [Caldilineaceae bacterium]